MRKIVDEMIYELTDDGDVIKLNLSSADYSVPTGTVIKGAIVADGTVLYVDIKNSDGTTVENVVIPCPGIFGMPDGLVKVHKTAGSSTDATLVTLVKKVP